MANIAELMKTIEQLRAAGPVAKLALADTALSQSLDLFRGYDRRLHEQAVTIDNLQDRLGAQDVKIAQFDREIELLSRETADG